MPAIYGFLKGRIGADLRTQPSHKKHEIQYHVHGNVSAAGDVWDVAINVGTDDADDLLNYKIVYDFHHPMSGALSEAGEGFTDLTGQHAPPALDFQRGDVLIETGPWRHSDVLDGSDAPEPVASLKRLLARANRDGRDVYVFGRRYAHGANGIHDVHQNQGSGPPFLNEGDDNDHNDIWQDGAVMVDLGEEGWAAYFTAFTMQRLPTDDLGNPYDGALRINHNRRGTSYRPRGGATDNDRDDAAHHPPRREARPPRRRPGPHR